MADGEQDKSRKPHSLPDAAKPYCFKPGQSGNPRGRVPGLSLKARLQALLDGEIEADDKDGNPVRMTRFEALARACIVGTIKKADLRFVVDLLRYMEPPVQRIQVDGDGLAARVTILQLMADPATADLCEKLATRLDAAPVPRLTKDDGNGNGESNE